MPEFKCETCKKVTLKSDVDGKLKKAGICRCFHCNGHALLLTDHYLKSRYLNWIKKSPESW